MFQTRKTVQITGKIDKLDQYSRQEMSVISTFFKIKKNPKIPLQRGGFSDQIENKN